MVFIFSNSVLAKIIKFRITAIMLNKRISEFILSYQQEVIKKANKFLHLLAFSFIRD